MITNSPYRGNLIFAENKQKLQDFPGFCGNLQYNGDRLANFAGREGETC